MDVEWEGGCVGKFSLGVGRVRMCDILLMAEISRECESMTERLNA